MKDLRENRQQNRQNLVTTPLCIWIAGCKRRKSILASALIINVYNLLALKFFKDFFQRIGFATRFKICLYLI